MSVRGLVLDCDGLLVDTEGAEFRAWCDVFDEHGVVLELEVWQHCIGTLDAFDPVAHLAELTKAEVDAEAARARYRARNDAYLEGLHPLPGVVDLIENARRRGWPLAVASTSPERWVRRHLEAVELLDAFAHLSCAGGEVPPKPAPDVYARAVAALGLRRSEAVAFEDSAHGVAAAKAAGLWCVAVPSRWTRGLDMRAADLVVSSLSVVDLDLLEEMAG